jgi:hypothetical protein
MRIEAVTMGHRATNLPALWRQAAYSFFCGLFGTLLIVIVLAGMLPLGETVRYLPWILVFNGSVAGYTLLERTGNQLKHKIAAGFGVGLAMGFAACAVLQLLSLQMNGMGLLLWSRTAIFTLAAALSGGAGAWLAVASAKLKDNAKNG